MVMPIWLSGGQDGSAARSMAQSASYGRPTSAAWTDDWIEFQGILDLIDAGLLCLCRCDGVSKKVIASFAQMLKLCRHMHFRDKMIT